MFIDADKRSQFIEIPRRESIPNRCGFSRLGSVHCRAIWESNWSCSARAQYVVCHPVTPAIYSHYLFTASLSALSHWKTDRSKILVSQIAIKGYFAGEAAGVRLASREGTVRNAFHEVSV